ncbi:MAG: DUF4595 domain-containing protein [Saprospiraceae bacterium]
MSRNLFYFVPICYISICGCKQTEIKSPANTTDPNRLELQIAFITYDTDPDFKRWYEYNEIGDFTRQGSLGDTIMYAYTKNKITKKHNKKANSIQSTVIYTTDDSGLITSSEVYEENDKMVSTYRFEYNVAGYLVKLTREDTNGGQKYIQTYTYKDGNLLEVKGMDQSGVSSSKYVYDFYPDQMNHLNLFSEQILEDIFPNERLGKMNKNLIRQFVYIDTSGDTLSHIKYEYLDEGDKNILVQKEIDVINASETIIKYHFVRH